MNYVTLEIIRYLVKIIFIQQAIADGHQVKYLGNNKFKFTLNKSKNKTKPEKFIKKCIPDFVKLKLV
jgi:hypothetical protein